MSDHSSEPRDWLQAKLQEYGALRAEILESIRAQHQVLVYAFAIIGVLTHASALVWEKSPLVATIVCWAGLPCLSCTFVFIWLGETESILRLGSYIAGIEQEVNNRIPGRPMGWESHLKVRRASATHHPFRANHNYVLFALLMIAFAAPLIGDAAFVQLFYSVAPPTWSVSQGNGFLFSWQCLIIILACNAISTIVAVRMWRAVNRRGDRMLELHLEDQQHLSGAPAHA